MSPWAVPAQRRLGSSVKAALPQGAARGALGPVGTVYTLASNECWAWHMCAGFHGVALTG